MYQAKDFIETAEGLLFAVVADGMEDGKVLCFLRYLRQNGVWQKAGTDLANGFLAQSHPEYLHYSPCIDASLHAVEQGRIVRHYQPRRVLQQLLHTAPVDSVVGDLHNLCHLLQDRGLNLLQFGVTGSLLIGMQNHASDIDLVCYDRETFHRARAVVQALIAQDRCQTLNNDDWLDAYRRRACDFELDEYIWHEQRKYNKAMINQRKFDLSLLVPDPQVSGSGNFRKLGFMHIEAKVIDDYHGFDYPTRLVIDHPDIGSVVCFTATYTGQAQTGERVAIAGQVEIDDSGEQRIVVGSNREAIGEFIRVLH